jgi:hypothetical protein
MDHGLRVVMQQATQSVRDSTFALETVQCSSIAGRVWRSRVTEANINAQPSDTLEDSSVDGRFIAGELPRFISSE